MLTPLVDQAPTLSDQPIIEVPDVETSSDDYAARFEGSVGSFFLRVQRDIVLGLLSQWPRARILDVGGGHAQLAVPLVQQGFDVTVAGSDPVCRKQLDAALAPGTFRFQTCRLPNLPCEDNEFDVVLAFRLMSHLHDWHRMIAELCRVARHAVIIDYPDSRSFNSLSNRFFVAKRALEKNTRPYRCFRRDELSREFAAAGFQTHQRVAQFFVPMVIHRQLRSGGISRMLESAFRVAGLTRRYGSPVVMCAQPSLSPPQIAKDGREPYRQ